ncbi:MAG: dihydroorotate dehydrogenase electron transfer subunit [Actinobacteria bacterium]|nr:MAG: dihydroorotate dehydrogenase electron transfer subunit [Actinomycetota bacterium]TMK65850.1 MAG: dihydroorotate dehydrogenase electron transfer subunit [Actinomycetota bacterium]
MRRVRAEILNARRLGAFQSITLVAPEIAERARPGQFVSVAMPDDRRFILRRHFSIHQASRRGGWAGTLEFVFDPHGPGTDWLAEAKAHQFLDVIGPLGKAFAYPRGPSNCLLVSEGHGASSIFFLAQELRARGKRVDMVLGASGESHVFKPIEAKRLSQTIVIVTADGSMGERGSVMDVVPRAAQTAGTEVIYAAGPRRMLRTVAEFCIDQRIPAQVAVEEEMACGTGLCFTCVVPVIRKDGSGYDNLRACTEGPVFNPARVFWDRWMSEETRPVPTPPEGFSPVVSSWPA